MLQSNIFKILFLLFFVSFGNISCKNEGSPTVSNKEEEHSHEEHGGELVLTESQFKAIKIQTGPVEMRNLTSVLHSTGFLKVPPQNKATISSQLGGTVKSISVEEGEKVKKNQVLVTLSNPEFIRLQQDYLDASSQLEFQRADFQRQKEMAQQNATSQKSFQQSEANFKSAQSKFQSLKQQLAALGVTPEEISPENISQTLSVRSPIDGNISHIAINIGSTVVSTNVLMDVVDNSQLHLDLFVYEQDLQKVKIGQPVDVSLTNLPGKHYKAEVFAIGTAFEGNSKSIPVHANIVGNKDGLIEGMNITASINVGTNLTSSVPSSAIINSGGDSFIFLLKDSHDLAHDQTHDHAANHEHHDHSDSKEERSDTYSFEKIQVKVGVTDAGFTEIFPLTKTSDDAQIVIEGAYYLMSMLTNEGEHEH